MKMKTHIDTHVNLSKSMGVTSCMCTMHIFYHGIKITLDSPQTVKFGVNIFIVITGLNYLFILLILYINYLHGVSTGTCIVRNVVLWSNSKYTCHNKFHATGRQSRNCV